MERRRAQQVIADATAALEVMPGKPEPRAIEQTEERPGGKADKLRGRRHRSFSF
ncbi:MAG: hypothetical protein WDN28_31645 [Chthoniobacter sp.]